MAAHHVRLGALDQFQFLDNPPRPSINCTVLGHIMTQTISYSLLTTMRYDPNEVDLTQSDRDWTLQEQEIATHIWLCPYHIHRLRSAAERHGWLTAAQFEVGIFLKTCLAVSKVAADLSTTDCAYKVRSCARAARRSQLT